VVLTGGGLLSRTFQDVAPKISTEVVDPPRALLGSNTTHSLYLFTCDGMAATVPVKLLPQSDDPEQGVAFATLSPLTSEAQIVQALSLPPELDTGYLAAITEQGEVKRLRLEDLPGLTANTIKFMDVEADDRLLWVGFVTDESELVLTTYRGQAIRFPVADVRPTGLGAGGMRAIKLADQRDRVTGAGVAQEGAQLMVVTDSGVAKSSPLAEYPVQGRAGSGVITMKLPSDAGGLVAAAIGRADEALVLVTDKNKAKQMKFGQIPQAKRAAKGDYVISMRSKEVIARVAQFQARIEVPEDAGEMSEEAS
jgi:DNA gyrase subunit A